MLWIGEVEDAIIIDELIASSSETGRPIPDYENLVFKIASGLMRILTGNFKEQVTTAQAKTQSEKRSLTGRQIDWKIHDFRKNSGDNEAILDFRDLSKVQVKNDNVQAFSTNWDEVLSAVSDRLTDRILESLYKMQVESRKT